VKVNRLDPVGLQDRQEEGAERRHQAGEDGEEEEGLRRRGQSFPRRPAVPDASGPHSLLLLPTISQTIWSSRFFLMRDSSRGAAGCIAASEDLAAPVALRGAMALSVGGRLQREVDG
jgi:hypothetical protein